MANHLRITNRGSSVHRRRCLRQVYYALGPTKRSPRRTDLEKYLAVLSYYRSMTQRFAGRGTHYQPRFDRVYRLLKLRKRQLAQQPPGAKVKRKLAFSQEY